MPNFNGEMPLRGCHSRRRALYFSILPARRLNIREMRLYRHGWLAAMRRHQL